MLEIYSLGLPDAPHHDALSALPSRKVTQLSLLPGWGTKLQMLGFQLVTGQFLVPQGLGDGSVMVGQFV